VTRLFDKLPHDLYDSLILARMQGIVKEMPIFHSKSKLVPAQNLKTHCRKCDQTFRQNSPTSGTEYNMGSLQLNMSKQ